MSRFSANDCDRLKLLLTNKSLKSSDDLKKNSDNNSHKKFSSKSDLKSKLFHKHNKNKLNSSNDKNEGKGNRNEWKDRNDSHFRSNLKSRIRSRNFGESHEIRSKGLAEKSYTRMCSSQFRSINEYLYSHSSSEANTYLTNEMFNNYHSIYEKIVQKWPQKPIDYIINKIKTFITEDNNEVQIADIGCGNLPQIKIAFPEAIVHSFDLISSNENIITADMTKLPLDHNQCDFAVFSLSLMATNIRDCLAEANRILKINGRLIIVEVLSRFDGNEDSFVKIMNQFGFELINKQSLPPNSFFIYFEFNKLKNCKKKNSLPDIQLKPCFYKPR